jgi:hypothetical protein
VGLGVYFDEIELALTRVQIRLTRLQDAEHLAVRSDHAYFGNADSLIYAGTGKDTLSRIEVGLIDGGFLRVGREHPSREVQAAGQTARENPQAPRAAS